VIVALIANENKSEKKQEKENAKMKNLKLITLCPSRDMRAATKFSS